MEEDIAKRHLIDLSTTKMSVCLVGQGIPTESELDEHTHNDLTGLPYLQIAQMLLLHATVRYSLLSYAKSVTRPKHLPKHSLGLSVARVPARRACVLKGRCCIALLYSFCMNA